MDIIGKHIKNITKDLKDFLETRIELLILNGSEKVAKFIAETIQHLFVSVLILIALIFLLFGLSFYLGELLGSNAIGFSIIGGFILIIGLLLVVFKPTGISRSIQKQIVNEIMQELEDADKNEQPNVHLPKLEAKRESTDGK